MTQGQPCDVDPEARASQIWWALQGIPRRCREILLLREIDRLPIEQICERMQLSRQGAEKLLARAIFLIAERTVELKQMARTGH